MLFFLLKQHQPLNWKKEAKKQWDTATAKDHRQKKHKSGQSDVTCSNSSQHGIPNLCTPTTIPTKQEWQSNTSTNTIELAQRILLFSLNEFFISLFFPALCVGIFPQRTISVSMPCQWYCQIHRTRKQTQLMEITSGLNRTDRLICGSAHISTISNELFMPFSFSRPKTVSILVSRSLPIRN